MIEVESLGLRAVAARISARRDELAARTVERFRAEIVGYQSTQQPPRGGSVEFVRRNIESLLDGLERKELVSEEMLATAREVAARRAHQGVSIEELLHQGRLWGETIWDAVLEEASLGGAEERDAALRIAGRLWRYVDVVSTAMAYAYIDEVNDRGLLSRDLLDSLLAGNGDDVQVDRLARMLNRRLADDHVVVIIRGDAVPPDNGHPRRLPARHLLEHIVDAARTHLRPTEGSLLIGIRQADVVALYPSAKPEDVARVRRECADLASALRVDVSIGMSAWHAGRWALASAYAEAREAVQIAAGAGIRGRAVVLSDVLVDHMLRASPHARWNLREALRPLVEYDRAHRAELVATLRAYLSTSTNLAESARLLMVHPNTVAYRLRRIRELTGRDPHVMEDLQILFLALKLYDLSPAVSARS